MSGPAERGLGRALDGADPRLFLPIQGLLDTALGRMQRQRQYATALARGGKRAEGLRHWITEATECIATLGRPEVLFMPLDARPEAGGLRLADGVMLDDAGVAQDVADGARLTAYLLTLNYSQPLAFDWLGKDYGAHHVQSDLGSEVLFALGREAHRVMRLRMPTGRMRRIPVLATEQCGLRRSWDPARVQALLTVFDGINPGVTVTDTGCFQPLHSLLGLTLHIPTS